MECGIYMFSCKERIQFTINEIEYSDAYEDNFELFTKGIDVLKKHDCNKEFSDEDRELLEDIFTIIN